MHCASSVFGQLCHVTTIFEPFSVPLNTFKIWWVVQLASMRTTSSMNLAVDPALIHVALWLGEVTHFADTLVDFRAKCVLGGDGPRMRKTVQTVPEK